MKDDLFDFGEQLVVGDDGERDFLKHYANLIPKKSDDRRIDFILGDGKKVELKTDTYDMSATQNFFMELFGNIDKGQIGGPWRAMQDNVDYFVYYFKKNKTYFWFESKSLCKHLDNIIAQGRLQPKIINNKGWAARGYAVPRSQLELVQLRKDSF